MGTLYARRETPNDSDTAAMLRAIGPKEAAKFARSQNRDVQLYKDAACTIKAARYPWHYSSKPTRRNKWVNHNCARYRLVWVEEKQ
jgi:hypothetical protein